MIAIHCPIVFLFLFFSQDDVIYCCWWLGEGLGAVLAVQLCWSSCICLYYLPNILTDTKVSSETSHFCVAAHRQGDKIAILVRYALVNCSSVHHLFSYEVSFSPRFPSLLKAWFEKRSFGVSRKATGEQFPTDNPKKNSFKRACNTTVDCMREKKCND